MLIDHISPISFVLAVIQKFFFNKGGGRDDFIFSVINHMAGACCARVTMLMTALRM